MGKFILVHSISLLTFQKKTKKKRVLKLHYRTVYKGKEGEERITLERP